MVQEAINITRKVANIIVEGDISNSATYDQRETTRNYTVDVSIPQPTHSNSGTVSGNGEDGEVSLFKLPALGVDVTYDIDVSNGVINDGGTEIAVSVGGGVVHSESASDTGSFTGSSNFSGTANDEAIHFYAEGGFDVNDDWSWDYSINSLEIDVETPSSTTITQQ